MNGLPLIRQGQRYPPPPLSLVVEIYGVEVKASHGVKKRHGGKEIAPMVVLCPACGEVARPMVGYITALIMTHIE